MKKLRKCLLLFTGCVLSLLEVGACLPEDTRATPGSVQLSVRGDSKPIRTVDGFDIILDRFFMVLGDAKLDGENCEAYSNDGYARIVDGLDSSLQRVNLLFGLGRCEVGFRIEPPAWDTLRGDGVSLAAEALLREAGTDAHASDQRSSVHLAGRAQSATSRKHFVWSFRRYIEYSHCRGASGDHVQSDVRLVGGEERDLEVVLRGAALFQGGPDVGAAELRFDPFRLADDEFGNADGEIDLEEIQKTPLDAGPWSVLGDRVYLGLLPELAKYQESGHCEAHSGAEDEDLFNR